MSGYDQEALDRYNNALSYNGNADFNRNKDMLAVEWLAHGSVSYQPDEHSAVDVGGHDDGQSDWQHSEQPNSNWQLESTTGRSINGRLVDVMNLTEGSR